MATWQFQLSSTLSKNTQIITEQAQDEAWQCVSEVHDDVEMFSAASETFGDVELWTTERLTEQMILITERLSSLEEHANVCSSKLHFREGEGSEETSSFMRGWVLKFGSEEIIARASLDHNWNMDDLMTQDAVSYTHLTLPTILLV